MSTAPAGHFVPSVEKYEDARSKQCPVCSAPEGEPCRGGAL